MTNTTALPAAWTEVEQIDGLDLVDKATLVEKPFLITAVQFTVNESNVSYVYVDAEGADGSTFTFNDSSTGVRKQIADHLVSKGQAKAIESGDLTALRLVIPRGLRVSEYEVQVNDPRTGRPTMKTARTYYLTTSGKRSTPAANAKPAARKSA